MTTPAKQSSRWGSFLQQALDGVESRLDNILVGDGPTEPVSLGAGTVSVKPEAGSSIIPSTQATNDRLQERLAKAIAAKKYAASRPDSGSSTPRVPSRAESPVTDPERSRQSIDAVHVVNQDGPKAQKQTDAGYAQVHTSGFGITTSLGGPRIKGLTNGLSAKVEAEESPRPSSEFNPSSILHPSMDSSHAPTIPKTRATGDEDPPEGSCSRQLGLNSTESNILGKSQSELEISDPQRQEEIYGYIERIDALQAKLQYLSRESAESARKAATAAAPNSVEKKLAEKDEQIALLMEEGQKLSKTELKHMTVIKKLRAKAAEADKEVFEAKRRLEKSDGEKPVLLDRLKRAEATEKHLNERQKTVAQLQKDLQAVTAERDTMNLTIGELKARLAEVTSQATASEAKAAQDLLAIEKTRIRELKDEITTLKIEKELTAGRAKTQLEDLRGKSEREAERARIAEIEMRAEQQMLESRLEVMRTRAEEVSSSATGDAQAKLLRQIETLQTQYAIASENWQGIEASLTTRVTGLQKERDEALKREVEMKRKAREMTTKWNRNEEELEDAHTNTYNLQRELSRTKEQLQKLQQHAEKSESALIEAKQAFEQEMQALKVDMQQRTEDDRLKWREDLGGHSPFSLGRAESPAPSSHRNLTADLLGLQNLQIRTPARSSTNELPVIEIRASRKSSTQHVRSSGQGTPQRQDSAQSYVYGDLTEPPSALTVDHDDYFEQVQSPSPTHPMAQDIFSISTVGAGPSVQLVERMSAAVRRLESEKMSTKDEVRRLAGQRDEARAQIVKLIKEVEVKRVLDKRVRELEEENTKINARYQTTLEMLGEKSELVDELKADVQDVKDMYRELVERTIK